MGSSRPASTTSRSPTTTSAMPATPGILQTIANLKKRGLEVLGRRQGPGRGPEAGDPRGRTARRLRSSATTRSPRAISRRRARPGSSQLSLKRATRPTSRRPASRRRGRRHRVPALGHRVPEQAVRGQQQLARSIIDAGADMIIGNHAHWVGGRRGLQGQADLVRARQLRVRPDLVRADDGGHHARADVPGRGAPPDPDAAAHHPGQGPAELPGPGRRRPGRAWARCSTRRRVCCPTDRPGSAARPVRAGRRRARRRGRPRASACRRSTRAGCRPPSPSTRASRRGRSAMNGESGAIWVTCSCIASHFRSSGSAGDVDPGRDRFVGHEHLGLEGLEFGQLLGRRVGRRRPGVRLGRASMRSRIAVRTEAGIACS